MAEKKKIDLGITALDHLCFQIGSKYYLMNLMEGKVEEGTILGDLMNRINAEMKKDMQKQAGGVSC